jgi:hypothetical protein
LLDNGFFRVGTSGVSDAKGPDSGLAHASPGPPGRYAPVGRLQPAAEGLIYKKIRQSV